MEYFLVLVIFVFGIAIGSFLAVILDRYNTGLPFLGGRSFCFSCNVELKGVDLFPIFSFVYLRGLCRYCKSRIPVQTIVVEVLMGVLTVIAAFKTGFLASIPYDFSVLQSFSFLILTAIFATILLVTTYDFKHFIIPDSFLVSLGIFSVLYYVGLEFGQSASFYDIYALLSLHLIAGMVLALPFLLIFLFSKGLWIGFGDVKYILVIGLLLGFSTGLSAVVLSFWIGAVVSVLLILIQRLKIKLPYTRNNLTIKSEIPFGPFLSLGVIISFCLYLDLFKINDLFPLFN